MCNMSLKLLKAKALSVYHPIDFETLFCIIRISKHKSMSPLTQLVQSTV